MADSIFEKSVSFEVPREAAFQWHRADKAFERLLPPWENVVVESKEGGIEGGTVNLKTYAGPVPVRWVAEHSNYVENEQFFDKSLSGPFKKWEHTHRFDQGTGSGGNFDRATAQSSLTDHIEYRLRGGFLASILMGGWVKRKLVRMFDYRHEVTKSDLEDHFQFADKARKIIAITGANGLVGKALVPFLENGGHTVIPLGRKNEIQQGVVGWNPDSGEVGFGEHEKVDCFVHLAGFGIADQRWSDSVKEKIRSSRSDATEKLSDFLVSRKLVSESLICASATGFYGDRAEETLSEGSGQGAGFLADICGQWENASRKVEDAGIRVAKMRFGILLNQKGGALSKLLLPFGLGLGGKIGSGEQYWSWISHLDAIRVIHFAIMNEDISGPVNVVAPHAVKVSEFAKILGRVLHRPSFLPFPAFAAKMMLGEMADHLLLTSCRAAPEKLLDARFRFNHETLEQALRFELGRKAD